MEPRGGRIFADWGGDGAYMILHSEENIDACLDWAGYRVFQYEVRDGLTSDGIVPVVQGENDLCSLLTVPNQGVGWEELVPDEEHEFQEGLKLDYPAVAFALGVFSGPEAKVEAQLDQVGNVAGIWVRFRGSCNHDGLDNAKGGGFSLIDWEIFNPVSFDFSDQALVRAGVTLGVRGISGVGEAI